MIKLIRIVLLITGMASAGLAQAPASVSGYTIRIVHLTDFIVMPNQYQSIDLRSDGTFVSRLNTSYQFSALAPGLGYSYNAPTTGTYTYQQVSSTQGTLTLSTAQYVLVFSNPSSGTISSGPAQQGFSLLPTGGVSSDRALLNLSSLISAQPGSPVSFGFVIGGTSVREVLIRGVGPSLAQFGLSNFAPNPTYTLNGAQVAPLTGSNWSSNPALTATVAAEDLRGGAFPLLQGSNDAADVFLLGPGAYTITVNPANATEGGAELLEVYEVE